MSFSGRWLQLTVSVLLPKYRAEEWACVLLPLSCTLSSSNLQKSLRVFLLPAPTRKMWSLFLQVSGSLWRSKSFFFAMHPSLPQATSQSASTQLPLAAGHWRLFMPSSKMAARLPTDSTALWIWTFLHIFAPLRSNHSTSLPASGALRVYFYYSSGTWRIRSGVAVLVASTNASES